MVMRLQDLTYTDAELEKDAIHFLENQVYEPSYANKVKAFIADDLQDFKHYYDDADYVFCNIYYDEYQKGYAVEHGNTVPKFDFEALTQFYQPIFSDFDGDEDDIQKYLQMMEAEFRKNACCTHMEPYFIGYENVVATTITGYARNPLFSVYSMVREWCMALHMKKLYPKLMRKFGYKYQRLRTDFRGGERLRRLIDFRDKYKYMFRHIGILRAIHSSVFAYAYLFLASVRTKEVITAEEFILESSSSKITMLLQGESIRNFDFPVTRYVLDRFKEGHYKEFFFNDGRIKWDALYQFTLEAIDGADMNGVHLWGFDSIEAKTMSEFWNKSPDLRRMLKILRRLALEGNNPVITQLIEMCEFYLGRPDRKSRKMEKFIEETRRIMAEQSYELTKPRTLAQDFVAAFPSVFLVYFQWHHNFRNIYPSVPHLSLEEQLRQQKIASDNRRNELHWQSVVQKESLKTILQNQSQNRVVFRLEDEKQLQADNENKALQNEQDRQNKMAAILENRQRTMAEMAMEHKEAKEESVYNMALRGRSSQNSY